MGSYYKVLIRKEKEGSPVVDTVADFGVWCAEMPFDMGFGPKEPTVRDWKDEDGEDSYTDGGLKMAAYDMKVKWCVKGERFSANRTVRRFLDYLSGRDGSGEKMEMYCDWTRIGRRHVRLKKVEGEATLYRGEDGDVVAWETTMRVEDPVTEIELEKRD